MAPGARIAENSADDEQVGAVMVLRLSLVPRIMVQDFGEEGTGLVHGTQTRYVLAVLVG